jgi:hypothetical protein
MTENAIVIQARYVRMLQTSLRAGESHLQIECDIQERKLDRMLEELDSGQGSLLEEVQA